MDNDVNEITQAVFGKSVKELEEDWSNPYIVHANTPLWQLQFRFWAFVGKYPWYFFWFCVCTFYQNTAPVIVNLLLSLVRKK